MPLPRTRPFRKPRLGTRLDAAHPLAHSLEACWLFHESNGNRAFDIVGSSASVNPGLGHDITLGTASTDTTFTQWAGGVSGPLLQLKNTAATNAGNLRANFNFSSTASWSFAARLHPQDLTNGYGCLLTVGATLGIFARNSGNSFHLVYYDGTDRSGISVGMPLNRWYDVGLSLQVDGASRVLTFYLNGEFDGTNTGSGAVSAAWNSAFNDAGSETYVGYVDYMYVWNRVLSRAEFRDLYVSPYEMFERRTVRIPKSALVQSPTVRAVYRASTPVAFRQEALDVPPSRAVYRASTGMVTQPARAVFVDYVVQRIRRTLGATEVNLSPGRMLLRANTLTVHISSTVDITPGSLVLRANDLIIDRGTFTVPAVYAQYRAIAPFTIIQVVPRDCGEAYDTALAQDFVAGDWLIQAAAIGLKLSFHYDPDGTWDHRIVDISSIEISAPPGGGMASVSNVTISVAEDGRGQSILQLWEQALAVDGVEITIDFLLDGQTTSLRVFTGRIDTMSLNDAVTQILCVDDSIHRNLLLPQRLVTSAMFANADSRVLTQPIPLIYGHGDTILAAPLMLVDVPTNTYLVADHLMTLTSTIAVLVPEVNRYLTYDAEASLHHVSALMAINKPIQEVRFNQLQVPLAISENVNVTNAAMAIDGFSTTIATILTSSVDSNLDGYGALGVRTSADEDQRGNNTVIITLTNHRRALTSDPTVTGTFAVQTLDSTTGAVLRDRLFVTEHFRQSLNPLTTSFTAPSINLGANEAIEVRCVARNEGGPGTAGESTTTTTTTTQRTITFTQQIGSFGTGSAQFSQPYALAIDSNGNLWVADTGNQRIQRFDSAGTFLNMFSTAAFPSTLAMDSANAAWITSTSDRTIRRYDSTGALLQSFGLPVGVSAAIGPSGITVSADGTLWILDTPNNTVHHYDSSGALLGTFTLGTGTITASSPFPGIAVDANIWVVDPYNSRVRLFSPTGSLMLQFGSFGTGAGQFNTNIGLALDPSGDVWVSDEQNARVQHWSSAGVFIESFGTPGTETGQFSLPSGLVFTSPTTFWVVDRGNNRLQFFTIVPTTTTTTTTTTAEADVYEVGEIGIESFYQPTGDSQQLFLYDDGWQGRTDVTGSVTGSVGTLLRSPAHVIASLMVQEIAVEIDTVSFSQAHSFYATRNAYFDGGIGLDWFVQRANARSILEEASRQAAATLVPTYNGTWGLIPYRTDTPVADSFDITNILATQGAENQAGDERGGTFEVTLGNLENVHTRFEVHYHYNAGTRQFDEVLFADEVSTNNTLDPTVTQPCMQAYLRYGKLEPMVIQAYWIADEATAARLLRHIVDYFSAQRLTVQFETTFRALCRQVTDRINVTYPFLPEADNGQAFEVHTIRIFPVTGRIQLVASKAAVLQNVVSPPAVVAQYRVIDAAVETLPPTVMAQYRVNAAVITANNILEPWEFVASSTPTNLFTETWNF